ncbi:hypothetical protein N7499_004372, partial [Penicillium canescens]
AGNYLHLTSSQPAGLFPTAHISAADIASAFALIIGDRISDIQRAAFLTLLHSTGKYRQADVIAKCSHHMRETAFVKAGGRPEGNYKGGLSIEFSVTLSEQGVTPTRLSTSRDRLNCCIANFDDY